MNSKIIRSAILSIDAYIVDVECNITGSRLLKFVTDGLPDGLQLESVRKMPFQQSNTVAWAGNRG